MAAIINNSADFITLETAPINPVYNAPTPTQATFSEYQGIEEPHKKGLKRKISKTEPLLLMCELCQVSLNSANQASQHYQGKIHQAKVCSSRGENLSEWTISIAGPTVSASAPTVPSTASFPPTTEGLLNLYCNTCGKSFNSRNQAQQHYVGRHHKSKVEQCQAEKTPVLAGLSATVVPSVSAPISSTAVQMVLGSVMNMTAAIKLGSNVKAKLFNCASCNITLNSELQFEQHVRGLRHKITTGQSVLPVPEDEGWQGIRYKKLAKVMNTEGVGTGAVPAPSSTPGGTRLGQFYCERCDISVNSQVQLQQHLTGEKHKMRVSGQLPVPSRDRGRGCHSGRSRGGIQGSHGAPPGCGSPAAGLYSRLPPLYTSFVKEETINNYAVNNSNTMPDVPTLQGSGCGPGWGY